MQITREELYQQVWPEPMQTLAGRFGIADVALAKQCRNMNIPLPGRGYWAKKAARKSVERDPLPALPPNSSSTPCVLVLRSPAEAEPSAPEAAPPAPNPPPSSVAAQASFEAEERNRVKAAATLRDPHRLIRKTQELWAVETRNGWQDGSPFLEP